MTCIPPCLFSVVLLACAGFTRHVPHGNRGPIRGPRLCGMASLQMPQTPAIQARQIGGTCTQCVPLSALPPAVGGRLYQPRQESGRQLACPDQIQAGAPPPKAWHFISGRVDKSWLCLTIRSGPATRTQSRTNGPCPSASTDETDREAGFLGPRGTCRIKGQNVAWDSTSSGKLPGRLARRGLGRESVEPVYLTRNKARVVARTRDPGSMSTGQRKAVVPDAWNCLGLRCHHFDYRYLAVWDAGPLRPSDT